MIGDREKKQKGIDGTFQAYGPVDWNGGFQAYRAEGWNSGFQAYKAEGWNGGFMDAKSIYNCGVTLYNEDSSHEVK